MNTKNIVLKAGKIIGFHDVMEERKETFNVSSSGFFSKLNHHIASHKLTSVGANLKAIETIEILANQAISLTNVKFDAETIKIEAE